MLQSYLYRTMDDLNALLEGSPKPTLRIVKGAYRESDEVAYKDKAEVDRNFRELLYQGLEAGATVGVATHDESIVRETEAYVRGAGLGAERYEFQFLYGVKPALQRKLVTRGHKVRIYIPYGKDWYGYFRPPPSRAACELAVRDAWARGLSKGCAENTCPSE